MAFLVVCEFLWFAMIDKCNSNCLFVEWKLKSGKDNNYGLGKESNQSKSPGCPSLADQFPLPIINLPRTHFLKAIDGERVKIELAGGGGLLGGENPS